MARLEFNNISIAALAAAVPDHIQSLEDAATIDPAQVRSFQRHTGVMQRHISIIKQTSLDLGCAAAHKALQKAQWDASCVDGLVFLSQTPDFNAGTGNAFLAHYVLGLREDVLAFDIPLACSSFPYGLSVCSSLLQQTSINRMLMISGDTQWHFYDDGIPVAAPDGRFMFGEAATAVLLEKNENSSPIHISLYTDGSGYRYLFNPLGGCRNAWEKQQAFIVPNGDIHIPSGKFGYMDGIEITSFSTTKVVSDIQKFIESESMSITDFDAVILHQANKQIVKTISKRLKLDASTVPLSLDRYGNTSGASVPLTIADAFAGSEKENLSLLLSAFGTGLSWGIATLNIRPAVIEPVFTCNDRFEEGFVQPCPGASQPRKKVQ